MSLDGGDATVPDERAEVEPVVLTVCGGRIEATDDGYIAHVVPRPAMPVFASYGPFATLAEAGEAIKSFWTAHQDFRRKMPRTMPG